MERFQIQKLIVISEKEKKSKEILFKAGLNIILGKNKTGKSSLIKSIFYTLGCEVKMEPSWKNTIDWYLLEFVYGGKKLQLIRHDKRFILTEIIDEKSFILIDTTSFHEFCDYITLQVFHIDFPFITNDLKPINVTTPILWRFQYIDQDKGWNKVAESFSNMKYIRNWKEFSNKFVIGHQGEAYYKLKKEINLLKIDIEESKMKAKHFQELLDHISSTITPLENSKNVAANIDIVKNTVLELEQLERKKFSVTEKLSELKNIQYEKNLALKLLQGTIKELEYDHSFAQTQEEVIVCPFCGTNHNNTVLERTEIIRDIQTGNELVKEFRKDLVDIEKEIADFSAELQQININLRNSKRFFENEKQGISIANTYKTEGKQEFINISLQEQNTIKDNISSKLGEIDEKNEELKPFESRKRANEIRNDFKSVYTEILNKLNIPLSFLKLRDFVQVLDNTGSELPRLIYAYHISLYLYNIRNNRGIFNWLIVDTPNQQGQDDENLKYIDNVMAQVMNTNGQFILGTERETGFETNATNVIKLTKHKQALQAETFQQHKQLIEKIIANSRVEF